MNFKQLFCKHIWQEINKTFLRKKIAKGFIVYFEINHYAVDEECIKCHKKRIVEIDYI